MNAPELHHFDQRDDYSLDEDDSLFDQPEESNTFLRVRPETSVWTMYLQELKENWDGDGAPAPNSTSIHEAREIEAWLNENDVEIESIDPDAMGGVDIYVAGDAGRTAWVAIMNEGARSIVFDPRELAPVPSRSFKSNNKFVALEQMKQFLRGARAGSRS